MGIFDRESATQVPELDKMAPDRNVPVAEATAKAAEGVAKRGRGRPKGSSSKTTARSENEESSQVMLDKLFDPKLWGPLVTAPADAMLSLSGHEHWNLSGTERETLAVTATTAAQYMGVENPRTLAFSLLLINLAMVYLPRTIKEFALLRATREEANKSIKS